MKMINGVCVLAAAAAMLVVGCANVRTAQNFNSTLVDGGTKPIESVSIENWGWYLFDSVPLITGDPKCPNRNTTCLFKDTVTLQNNMEMLADEMEKRGGATHLANVNTDIDDDMAIGFFVFARRTIHTSATITKAAGVTK